MTLIETLTSAWLYCLVAVAVVLFLYHVRNLPRMSGLYASLLYRLQKDHPDILDELLSTHPWHANSGVPVFDKARFKAFIFNDEQNLTPKTETIRREYLKYWKQSNQSFQYLIAYGGVFLVTWIIGLLLAITGFLPGERPQEPASAPHSGRLMPSQAH